MTFGVEQHEQHRRLLVALVLAVLALVVGVGVGVDAHASSSDGQVGRTRVAAHELLAGPVVAASEDITPGEGRRSTTRTPDLAIGLRVAPNTASRGADFVVDSRGTAIPTDAGRLRAGLERSGGFQDASTSPATSRKFVGTDHGDPIRIRIEKGHPMDPAYAGPPDPLHGVDHLHVERRANGATGPWREQWKIPYTWPF